MTTTWADIQRLAADLQRVQLAEGAKRLSEKNCVEVVSILLASKAIDIVFTSDGREYLTKKHLITEVENECIGSGGRVSLSDLTHSLKVNYEHIEEAVQTILKQSNSFILCNAELISREYIDSLCKELNENLSESGVLSVAQLATSWNLSSEILNTLVLSQIGSKINAIKDGDQIYTKSYLQGQKNLMRAIMSSLTRVTPIPKVASYLNLSNVIFWQLYDELLAENEISGTVVGGRSSYHAHFVPELYTLLVRSFVKKTFQNEQLLEVSIFKRLSVSDPIALLKEVFSESEYSSLLFFSSVIIAKSRWDELYEGLTEEMERDFFVDLDVFLPSAFSTDEDMERVISLCLKSHKEWYSVIDKHLIYRQELLTKALRSLDNFISKKSEEAAALWERKSKLITKAERQKLDESATTSKVKKGRSGKVRGGKQAVRENPYLETAMEVFDFEELQNQLESTGDFPQQLLESITEQISDTVKISLRNKMETILQNARNLSAKEQKRSHSQFQESIQTNYNRICVFELGVYGFPELDGDRLISHLCRTLCNETAHMILSFISGIDNAKSMSPKVRDETIKGIESTETREALSNLFLTIEENDINGFHDAMATISSPAVCSFNLKVPDKKQRAELVKSYEEGLEKQLSECNDAATGLLISLLLLFTRKRSVAVHATGKFVSVLIREIGKVVTNDTLIELLNSTENLVIEAFKDKKNEQIKELLAEKLQQLKDVLLVSS